MLRFVLIDFIYIWKVFLISKIFTVAYVQKIDQYNNISDTNNNNNNNNNKDTTGWARISTGNCARS